MKQLLNASAQIRVDASGIYAARVSKDTIPWSAITAIEPMTYETASVTQKFAMVRLLEHSPVTFTRGYKLTQKANMGFDYDGARILLNGHAANPDEIWAAIEAGFQRYKT